MRLFAALKGREEYDHVSQKGKIEHMTYFTFRVLATPAKQMRVAIVVSKKVSPKATERNLLRRRVREYLRRNQSPINGCSIIIFIKQGASALSRKELYEQLRVALARL